MFSVVIPLYNKEKYLRKAVQSVLNQTFRDFELIIVDDGSTDGGLQKVMAIKDDRIKIIQQENKGVSTARNNGVKSAKYDFIAFLDADDWWEPNYLKEMSKLVEEYKDAAIWGASYYKVKNGRNIPANIGVEKQFERGYINYCQVYAKTFWMPIWAGSVVLKKNVFEEMNGFKPNLKIGEDFDLWIRIALKYPVAFLNKPLAYYNQDVDTNNRALKSNRLYKIDEHCLFNIDYLKEDEASNASLKSLIDALRVYSLFSYFLDRDKRRYANIELEKVDWSKQPLIIRIKYKSPIIILLFIQKVKYVLSRIKQLIILKRQEL